MQEQTKPGLSAQDQAYIRMLELHFNQFIALLHDMGGTQVGQNFDKRELSLAYIKLEEAFYHSREFVLRQAGNRARVN